MNGDNGDQANDRTQWAMWSEVTRLNHWFKNLFVVIGSLAALSYFHTLPDGAIAAKMVLVLLASCLLSSVNYIINGIVDKQFDSKHPRKKNRAIPLGLLKTSHLVIVGGILLIASLGMSHAVLNHHCTVLLFIFFLAGILYNIRPMRTKDLPYVDVVSEAANNPIRLLLGWFAVAPGTVGPPASLILLFWCFGCFLMTAKRYAEFRFLKEDSVGYRITFRYYTQRSLYAAMMLYNLATLGLYVLFCRQHHPRLLYGLPGILAFVVWFLVITAQEDSIVKEPEKIYRHRAFFAYSLLLTFGLIWLSR